MSLYEAKNNNTYRVTSTPNIGLLESLGVRTGTQITVQNRYSFGGPILLRIEDACSVALGKVIAKQITVEETASFSSGFCKGAAAV